MTAPAWEGVRTGANGSPSVMLFTDTLGDVNGVSRFIRNAADQALATGRDLTVVTSTRFELPDRPNIVNVPPRLATKMPKYENLELVAPPLRRLLALARARRPDVIHVSTPGPVGMVGRMAARKLGVPVLGVYHTDFPAYIEHLFEDEALTWMCRAAMRWFYGGFRTIFTRSEDYKASLMAMGFPGERILRLRPGIRTQEFDPRLRDQAVWGEGRRVVRALYVGRVSVEKNMPLLTRVWREAGARLRGEGLDAELVVVGDGPYRERMEQELVGAGVRFLGFKYGEELSRLYASSDLFIFPSTTDTLGQVVMEAQSSGLPVLVTDQGGPKEVVRHGETGFVIPAERPGEWVERIIDLVRDRGRREKMGKAAQEFLQDFSMAKSFEHFWGVHEGVWRESGK